MVVLRYYGEAKNNGVLLSKLRNQFGIIQLDTELCFYINITEGSGDLDKKEEEQLLWILSTPFCKPVSRTSHLIHSYQMDDIIIEIGPRLNFSTPTSTNAVSICQAVGLVNIDRIEITTRYHIKLDEANGIGQSMKSSIEASLTDLLHDKMTQCRYNEPLQSFHLPITTEDVYEVDILSEGQAALEKANHELGLALDDWDLTYYTNLFRNIIKRNPTSVECFDLAQSNSEHCRHWFFRGQLIIDGEMKQDSLFDMVMSLQNTSNRNNIISFSDNSSAIAGSKVEFLLPMKSDGPSAMSIVAELRHLVFTAETHNFPTGVAPFPGAATGTGGRIRDIHATGRGAHVVAGMAGYCFGNLLIPAYELPWEDRFSQHPSGFASPLEIALEASNGASDYGNKFGEPVVAGFTRSFGMELTSGDRREYIKPIMFSAGIGLMEDAAKKKCKPETGMDVVKIGGPVYRVGVGGGAASSIHIQGDNTCELDFGAVQRGDAEMEQKLNRVVRACFERRPHNPILSIHDQGAGGNGNVLKEITEPAGALIKVSRFQFGDPTISILELWGAEYQENTAVLVSESDRKLLEQIADREKCPVSFVGKITGDKKIRLEDDRDSSSGKKIGDPLYPVNLDLELILGKMPQKKFNLSRHTQQLQKLSLPPMLSVMEALNRVLRLPSVGSKRYLTNKVDRSVSGLVAQQQCVGPLHTPLADVAVIALSHFTTIGGATAIGEQPIKGLVSSQCGARMTVGEALTNLIFAPITDLKDVKCSGNWMWPAKLPGEGAALYDTCDALCDVMRKLGIAVDGGKDSLSMAARVGPDVIKAPGTLVVSVYAMCTDITAVVTPDLKCPNGKGILLYVPFSPGHHRLGGSALAQCYKQIGDEAPNLDDVALFTKIFYLTQQLIKDKKLVSGHDVSDGGLVTCILEMAFAGNCGLSVDIQCDNDISPVEVMFAEELGLILEVDGTNVESVVCAYKNQNIKCLAIGSCQQSDHNEINISVNGDLVIRDRVAKLRNIWEETSFHLDQLQANPECVLQEQMSLLHRSVPKYHLTFDPYPPQKFKQDADYQVSGLLYGLSLPRVAVVREEGSNGDREMAAAFTMAGFETWDITVVDLIRESVTLDTFTGLAFVGGFSYADVFGSAKGWAATLKFNYKLKKQLDFFYNRQNTFSLGVCNGCQLMALLGWVAPRNSKQSQQEASQGEAGVHFTHNLSARFESRFTTVRIEPSPAIMLQGMVGSVLGIWLAHGEGRVVFRDESVKDEVLAERLVPIKYVDDEGIPTECYPMNPNGSSCGIAALCSSDGRHLAMMPHPERCVLPWQWPWMPFPWRTTMTVSPWLQMFTNAFNWCKSFDP